MTASQAQPPRTFLDLFCGCGGFSLGMQRAGFEEIASIDFDQDAISTFRKNFPGQAENRVIKADLTVLTPDKLDALLMPVDSLGRRAKVDVIVGGPPCQGFSPVRRVGGGNHGEQFVEDARRSLYKQFLNYVAYYQPRVFVMENVLGIKSAAGGDFFTRVQSEARALGYRVHGVELRAWRYGVPQKRIRQIIIGTRRELPIFSAASWLPATHADPDADLFESNDLQPFVSLWEAIGDLPVLGVNQGKDISTPDERRRQSQIARYTGRFLKKVVAAHRSNVLTGHVSRPHSERDLRDFDLLHEGESSAVAMRDRKVVFEWPYSKEHFKDRYTRQHRNRLCSTIVAHLSKDGLMFIHPKQRRSLTPREAARIQTFPDWFQFPTARTHAFRLIGNAVPPLLSEAIGRSVRKYLNFADREWFSPTTLRPLPKNIDEAVGWLEPLVAAAKRRALAAMPLPDFKRGWYALGCLNPHLHPDGAHENGRQRVEHRGEHAILNQLAPHFITPIYEQSGWPVSLVPVALEAERRHRIGSLRTTEYLFSEAQFAGSVWQTEK